MGQNSAVPLRSAEGPQRHPEATSELTISPDSDVKVEPSAQDAELQTPVASEALTLLRNEVKQHIDALDGPAKLRLRKLANVAEKAMPSVPFFLMRTDFCLSRTMKAEVERL
jgi:hypothetical protein